MPLDTANKEQKEAITHGDGPLLIVAGAGTGKTRVITERIAWLIMEGKCNVDEVLALTFTEKAAGEMEERVDQLLPYGYVDLWVSTFHSFCEKILKRHALDVGLNSDYKLLNETASWLLVRKNLDRFNLEYYKPLGNPTKFIHALLKHFSRCKDEGIDSVKYLKYAEEIKSDDDDSGFVKKLPLDGLDEFERKELIESEVLRITEIAEAFDVYQQLLIESNAMDFADLISNTVSLLKKRPLILNEYRIKFKYILVDEYQDTNFIQNELIKILSAPKNNLTVVGDDDQSIYRFRGSSIENIMQFKTDFPTAKSIVLTKNYRSTQEILDRAHTFIKQNDPHRLEVTLDINKKLESQIDKKGTVEHLHLDSIENEAITVVNKMLEIKEQDKDAVWNDFAVLVRANNSAAPFVETLSKAKVPYQFLALRGLYNKPIILDIVNYFKLLDNYHESSSVHRVLNFPFLQIDPYDIAKISHYAGKKTLSLFEVIKKIDDVPSLNPETVISIKKITEQIDKDTLRTKDKKLSEIFTAFLYESGYIDFLYKKNDKQSHEDISCLQQFASKISSYESGEDEDGLSNFMSLLQMELDAGDSGTMKFDFDDGPDMVKIMTVHGSKGLEFKYVFIVSLVDRKFPSDERREPIEIPTAMMREKLPEDNFHIEEERRLFYVAMTRAKEKLYFSSAEDYGGARSKKHSRFLIEMGYGNSEDKAVQLKEKNKKEIARPTEDQGGDFELNPSTKFSFSALNMYSRCPYQYYLARVLRLPTFGKPSLTFGDVIHRTLNDFVDYTNKSKADGQSDLFNTSSTEVTGSVMSLQDLYTLYEKNWVDDWYEDKEQKEKYYAVGKEIMKKFHAYYIHEKPVIMMVEQPFKIKIGPYVMSGRIDRVDTVDGGVEIIDYKTGESKGKLTTDDKDQLLLYQIAAEDILQLKPVNLTYHYLNKDEKLSFLGNDKQKQKLKDKWLDKMNQVHAKNFDATPGEHVCKFCDFKGICEFRKM